MIFLKYLNYACKIIVIPKQIPTQNCFYLVIHFLSSTTNVILHPLNTHFSKLIPRPVYTLFSQQRSDYLRSYLNNSSLSPTGISKHSKTINKNTRPCASCFHTLFSRVWISWWNTRSRCSNITSILAKGFIILWNCVYTLGAFGPWDLSGVKPPFSLFNLYLSNNENLHNWFLTMKLRFLNWNFSQSSDFNKT